jgi:LysR family transcriptional regulator, regulator of gene expression of beta-lactamase
MAPLFEGTARRANRHSSTPPQVLLMPVTRYSLNTLHAFAAAAGHLNFTRAAEALCVTQTAVSHQVKLLEAQIGRPLFLRTPRGLQLTDEGALLAPPLQAAFEQIEQALMRVESGQPAEALTLGVVGTFAHGFLLERLPAFQARHPRIDLRLQLNNNRVDLAAEGLDAAIRFGDGAWRSLQADPLLAAPLAPLCSPALADTLRRPEDLRRCVLLRSYRAGDWPAWSHAAGLRPLVARGPQFDSSVQMVQAAQLGAGVALAPPSMFQREILEGRLRQPFDTAVDVGRYWLTQPLGRRPRPALRAFERWLQAALSGAATIPA